MANPATGSETKVSKKNQAPTKKAELTKTNKKEDIELKEEDLQNVTGGTVEWNGGPIHSTGGTSNN